jgi:hypothetical protein
MTELRSMLELLVGDIGCVELPVFIVLLLNKATDSGMLDGSNASCSARTSRLNWTTRLDLDPWSDGSHISRYRLSAANQVVQSRVAELELYEYASWTRLCGEVPCVAAI